MLLVIHILIALSSIVQTTVLLFAPSSKKLTINYLLFGGTVISGTYLVISKPVHIVQTCIVGLLYMGFVIAGIIITQIRLSKTEKNYNE